MTRDDDSADDSSSGQAGAATYLGTYVALLALATGSLLLSRLHVGGLAVSLVIAAVKALLVLWIFMDLSRQRASSRVAIMLAAMLMALLVALTCVDVSTRHTFPARTEPPPASGFYER